VVRKPGPGQGEADIEILKKWIADGAFFPDRTLEWVLASLGAALFFFYIEPTINKLGPDAEKFVDELINKRKAPIYFAATSTVAVLAGLALYYRQAGGFQLWTTTPGLIYTVGAIAAIIAWIGGNLLITPAVKNVGAIGQEMKNAGVDGVGNRASRWRAYSRSALIVLWCSGTSRCFFCLPARTCTTPSRRSTSWRSSASASPGRIPVTASSPIIVT